MTPVLGDPNVTAFLKALSLNRFCSTCTPTWKQPVTRGRKFIYADDMFRHSRPILQRTGMQSLVNMARISHFCRQWRLKPSTSKTISSVFHLHNTSATRELSVYLDGQSLRHECNSTYLRVTLDRTLSYREHWTKAASKLKNRNNLLMKLAGSTGGASAAPTLCGYLLWCFAIQQQSTVPQSGHALLTQVRLMCS